jgi:pseudoazurin
MKLLLLPALACALLAVSPANASEWQVKMVNAGTKGGMEFVPAFVAAKPGDTVKFLATDRGHNAETIAGMIPAGATPFKGKINEEIVVRLTLPGLYGVKCQPHLGMGMVGLIQVGKPVNKDAAAAAASALPALARKTLQPLVSAAK